MRRPAGYNSTFCSLPFCINLRFSAALMQDTGTLCQNQLYYTERNVSFNLKIYSLFIFQQKSQVTILHPGCLLQQQLQSKGLMSESSSANSLF